MLFSFDVQISFCFPFFFLKLMIPQLFLGGVTEYEGGSSTIHVERRFYLLMMQTFPELVKGKEGF